MNRQSWLLNLSLLKTHPAFRAVFIARFISILSLGLLGVAIPVQIQMMTHSTWHCLLYTSDAADDLLCVDLGRRRIIKKKKKK